MKLTINSDASLSHAIGELRHAYKEKHFLRVTIASEKMGSASQQGLAHLWYQQIAQELREDTALGIKSFCKLHYAVPILRAENDEFREAYDASIKPMPYERKLAAMALLPVTSLMSTMQLSQYLEAVQAAYVGRVNLQFPDQ